MGATNVPIVMKNPFTVPPEADSLQLLYILTKRRMESHNLKKSTKNTIQKIPEELPSTEIIKKGKALSSLTSEYFRRKTTKLKVLNFKIFLRVRSLPAAARKQYEFTCKNSESVFVNVHGAQESIPRDQFRQPM